MAASAAGSGSGPDPATELVGPGPYPLEWIIVDGGVLDSRRVWLRFADGLEAIVDISHDLTGPVFEPLQDAAYFASGSFDPESGTIAWPNGADFAPEHLRDLAEQAAKASRTKA